MLVLKMSTIPKKYLNHNIKIIFLSKMMVEWMDDIGQKQPVPQSYCIFKFLYF